MSAILIVEDDKNHRLLLTEGLEEEGYTTSAAASATEALAKILATPPDLVVLDLGMPGMDGIELLEKLRQMDRRLPIVIYTGYSSSRASFMAWVADAYVVKRSCLGELKDTIREILAGA